MTPPAGRRALVVFSGRADLWWLRLLRPGFRHCFVVLEADGVWICVNPLAHRTSVEMWSPEPGSDLAAWLRGRHGLTVVEAEVGDPPRRPSPIGLYSCVEAVKRVLGIQARWVLTPGQLYDRLQVVRKKSLTESDSRNMVNPSTPEPCPNQPPATPGRRDRP